MTDEGPSDGGALDAKGLGARNWDRAAARLGGRGTRTRRLGCRLTEGTQWDSEGLGVRDRHGQGSRTPDWPSGTLTAGEPTRARTLGGEGLTRLSQGTSGLTTAGGTASDWERGTRSRRDWVTARDRTQCRGASAGPDSVGARDGTRAGAGTGLRACRRTEGFSGSGLNSRDSGREGPSSSEWERENFSGEGLLGIRLPAV